MFKYGQLPKKFFLLLLLHFMKLKSSHLLVFILVLSFFLRVYKSDSFGLYLDEKYTIVISQGIAMEGANQKDVFFTEGKKYFTPQEFWKEKTIHDFIEANIRGDIGNSPTYYAVLWTWIKVFGLSDFSLRFLSVLFSTMIVGMLYIFVKRHFQSESLALLSAFIAGIEPFFVAYSHMARNYSVSFFLTLLATHLFLIILEHLKEGKPVAKLYLGYGLVFVLSILSHYLTLTVFLSHGVYAFFYMRPLKRWVPFILTAIVGSALVSLWFMYGGGKYTFQTLAYQAKLYGELAQTDPYNNGFAVILPATLVNVATKSLPLWADLLMISNGLGQVDTLGIRNMAMALVFGFIALFILIRYLRSAQKPIWMVVAFGILLVVGFPLYTTPRLQYIVLAALPTFVFLLIQYIRQQTTPSQKPLLVFMAILSIVPTLFLVLMSFKNNHTYGLTQRYSGFSFPYSIIFVSMMLLQALRLPKHIKIIIGLVTGLQVYFIISLLVRIYQDRDPKYTYFVNSREANPYYRTAQKIKELYVPGDTILYPSVKLNPRDEIEKTYDPYSIMDAQLTNIYLPKDATYWQRMDTTQTDQVILVKADGKREILFDFEGTKFRY
jgi:4-amino-4-deoxy-L-arabinose transferase-like glycosyltransferase